MLCNTKRISLPSTRKIETGILKMGDSKYQVCQHVSKQLVKNDQYLHSSHELVVHMQRWRCVCDGATWSGVGPVPASLSGHGLSCIWWLNNWDDASSGRGMYHSSDGPGAQGTIRQKSRAGCLE